VYVIVPKSERGEMGYRKYNVRGDGAGVVATTFGARGVDYREASGRGVEKAVRGEEVQGHNITPSKRTGER